MLKFLAYYVTFQFIIFLPEWYNGKSIWAESAHRCGGGLCVGLFVLGVLWLRAEGSVVIHGRWLVVVVLVGRRVVLLAHALIR